MKRPPSLVRRLLALCAFLLLLSLFQRPVIHEDSFTKVTWTNHSVNNGTFDSIVIHDDETSIRDQVTTSTTHAPYPNRTLYTCGFDLWNFYQGIFNDFHFGGRLETLDSLKTTSHKDDVLLYGGLDGPCHVQQDDIRDYFKGKVLFVNSEPRIGNAAEKQRLSDRWFKIGPTEHSGVEPRTLPVYFGAIFWYATTTVEQRASFWQTARRQERMQLYEEQHNAVVFLVSNCVSFRREVAARIAEIVEVHHGPKCGPPSDNAKRIPHTITGRGSYMDNYKLYSKYRYCLVMENHDTPGYITEKIILAYLGGCIPIYWGTAQVLDVFHPQSFIYYNATDPDAALVELRTLQANASALEAKRSAPILARGDETIQKYFSLDDSIGDGILKRQIRQMMGIMDED